jgi:hypothetical protein
MEADGGSRVGGWPTGRARLARWGKNAKTAGSVIGPAVQSQPKSDSKNVILNNAARPLTVSALLAALALTACSAPEAGSAPSSAAASPAPSSATASPSKSSGQWGDFATAAEACTTISEQATGSTLLPLSAAQGSAAELEQTKAELTRTAERAPDSIKADFTTLSQVAIAGIKDQTVFSSGKLQDAMAPVQTWLATNCG